MKNLLGSLLQLSQTKYLLGVPYLQYALPTQRNEMLSTRAFSHSLGSPLSVLFVALDECIQNPKKLADGKTLRRLLLARDHLEALYSTWRGEHSRSNSKFMITPAVQESLVLSGLSDKCQVTLQLNLHKNTRLKGNKVLFQEMLSCLFKNAHESYAVDDPYKSIICVLKQNPTSLQLDIIDSGSGMTKLAQVVAGVSGVSFKNTGSGVGLPFARTIVTQVFSGTLYICSQAGQGTRISIRLPL
jgi:K+-sensing histidine kinase KdpD